jgi:hypothetical protein
VGDSKPIVVFATLYLVNAGAPCEQEFNVRLRTWGPSVVDLHTWLIPMAGHNYSAWLGQFIYSDLLPCPTVTKSGEEEIIGTLHDSKLKANYELWADFEELIPEMDELHNRLHFHMNPGAAFHPFAL